MTTVDVLVYADTERPEGAICGACRAGREAEDTLIATGNGTGRILAGEDWRAYWFDTAHAQDYDDGANKTRCCDCGEVIVRQEPLEPDYHEGRRIN